MEAANPYDSALQMFVQTPREADVRRLEFLRWLAEHSKLEHGVAGPSSGRYALAANQTGGVNAAVAA
jgi:hypothetical protein